MTVIISQSPYINLKIPHGKMAFSFIEKPSRKKTFNVSVCGIKRPACAEQNHRGKAAPANIIILKLPFSSNRVAVTSRRDKINCVSAYIETRGRIHPVGGKRSARPILSILQSVASSDRALRGGGLIRRADIWGNGRERERARELAVGRWRTLIRL